MTQRAPDPRRGLERIGMATYVVAGPNKKIYIRRNGRHSYYVSDSLVHIVVGCMTHRERTLTKARSWAEWWAGIKP